MSILTLPLLATYEKRADEHQLSMSLLADYYEAYLYPHYYDFTLNDGTELRIDFHKDHFCHLVGVDQISSAKFRNPNDHRLFMHRGTKGFKRSRNGNITFSYLKNLHSAEYEKQQEKFFFFHFLHVMMESENIKLVNYAPIPNSTIRCDFMFHDKYDNALLHLGVEKDAKTGYFFPKTFFVRYFSDASVDAYIQPQTPVSIESMIKTPR